MNNPSKQGERDYCKNCGSLMKVYELDYRSNRETKVEMCPKCRMLHVYKRDIFGKWHLMKASSLAIPNESERLIEAASFLGLDANWSLSTSALQLQEVAVTLIAEEKGILLDKANVERVLERKIQDLSFNDRYEAFAKHAKELFDVKMPILTGHLRKMRTQILHKGYNPQKEETDSIVSFTVGLLDKLKAISELRALGE